MRQKKSKQTDETANQQSLDIRTGLSTEDDKAGNSRQPSVCAGKGT